jgi:hypothetical protein
MWDCPLTVSLCEYYLYETHLYKAFRLTVILLFKWKIDIDIIISDG